MYCWTHSVYVKYINQGEVSKPRCNNVWLQKKHMQLDVVKMRKWATKMHVTSSRTGKTDVRVTITMKIQIFWDMMHGRDGYPHRLGLGTLSRACTHPEDRGIKLLWNIGNYLVIDTAPYPWKLESLIETLTWPSINNSINAVFQCYITAGTVMDSNGVIMPATTPPTKKIKVNYKLLPIKVHYFFFMACK